MKRKETEMEMEERQKNPSDRSVVALMSVSEEEWGSARKRRGGKKDEKDIKNTKDD